MNLCTPSWYFLWPAPVDYKPETGNPAALRDLFEVSRRRLMAETSGPPECCSPRPSWVSRIVHEEDQLLWISHLIELDGELGFLQILMWHHWPMHQNSSQDETLDNGDHCVRDALCFCGASHWCSQQILFQYSLWVRHCVLCWVWRRMN